MARTIWQTFSGSYCSLPPDASKHCHLPFSMHICCTQLPTAHGHVLYWSGLPRLSECAQSGWEAIGNPVLRRKSSFTFRCSWALYGNLINCGHRRIIQLNIGLMTGIYRTSPITCWNVTVTRTDKTWTWTCMAWLHLVLLCRWGPIWAQSFNRAVIGKRCLSAIHHPVSKSLHDHKNTLRSNLCVRTFYKWGP